MADESSAALQAVTEAAFNGVLRALEARKLDFRRFPGPILVGIIAWPELQQASQLGEQLRGGGQEA